MPPKRILILNCDLDIEDITLPYVNSKGLRPSKRILILNCDLDIEDITLPYVNSKGLRPSIIVA
jgi:hypothetical protein